MGENGHAAHSHHQVTDIDNRKFGMWILIASECFLFGTMISNYLLNRDVIADGPGPKEIYNIDLTTASTFVLLMSSVAMVLALDGCVKKQLKKFQMWTGVVIIFGLIFLGCQAYEFWHFMNFAPDRGLGFSTSVFGSSFYMLTGCHGAHVVVGVLWMSSILITSLVKGDKWFNPDVVEVAGLYWHFVDVIWILIFTIVYLFTYVTL